LAAAINDDSNYNTTLTTALATKLPLAGGTLTGNLSIGAGTPGDITLKVHSNDSDDYIAIFKQTHASNLGTIQIDTPSDSNARPSRLDFARGGVNKWKTGMVYGDSLNGWGLSDATGSGTALQQTRFLVTPTGNVGIGTTNPAHKLHIKSTAHDEPIALFEADTGQGGDVSIRLEGGKVGNPDEIYIEFNDRDDPTNSFTIGMDDDSDMMYFGYGALGTTNNHRQMGLSSSGNLGLGTTPNSYTGETTLTINGSSFGRLDLEAGGTLRSSLFSGSTYTALVVGTSRIQIQDDSDIQLNTQNTTKLIVKNDGKVGIGDTDPPSTLTVLGDNSADVVSNGAGINGLQITRTAGSGENLYAYIGNGSLVGWGGTTFPARIESFGCNALEIGSQQNAPVVIAQNNTQKIRVKGDITTHAKFGSTYIESLYTPNGGVQNCRIFEDHLGKWVAVGYFAANAGTSIQGTWSSVRGGPTGISQTETTQFSADWGDSYPTEVRYMGATDFYNFNETKTIDFVHGVPRGRPWKEFFNNAQRRPDAVTPHSGTSHMGSVQGPTGSEKYGWECRGAYDGRGRWHNPGYTHHRMSDINSTTHLSCPTAAFTTATSNAFNWNTYQDAKISVHHSFDYSGQDTGGYSAAFGRDDTVIGFYDDYPNSRSNMMASTNNYGSAVYVLMKLPEMQSIGLEGGRSRDHMPGEVVQTKVYERNADVSATSGLTGTFGYLDFTPLYGNSILEFNIHANTGSNDGNTVVWKIYQGTSGATGTLIRRTGNQIINNDGNTDGQELPFSWTQYYQLNDDKKSTYRYRVQFSPSGATYWGHTYGSSAHSYFTIKEIKQEHNATTVTS